MFMLTKSFSLVRPEYDQLVQDVFQFPILERQYSEINELIFRMKYISKYHPEDVEELAKTYKMCSDANAIASSNWGVLLKHVIRELIERDQEDGVAIGALSDLFTSSVLLTSQKISFVLNILSEDRRLIEYFDRVLPNDDNTLSIYPDKFYRFHSPSYNDSIESCFPEKFETKGAQVGRDDDAVYVHNLTMQTSENCNLNCTYCYQCSKTASKMTFETGKKFIDGLLSGEYGYINDKNSPALIMEFIGGDPFLEMPLTRKLYEYFLDRTYALRHPWFQFHRVSLCSNGLLYFDQDVQSFFQDFSHKISFNISIDGNRELHDACRIQPNGEGSYDVDMTALKHYSEYYASEKNSKMTLAPSNIKYLFESVVDFIGQGMAIINLNCIFEEGWTIETALLEYTELKRLADHLLEHDLEHLFIAIFSDDPDTRWDKEFDGNFCFAAGTVVQTAHGPKTIEDVSIGDMLMTGRSRFKPVERVACHMSHHNMSITVNGTFPTYCTSDHSFFTKTSDGMVAMTPLKDISQSDHVALSIHGFGEMHATSPAVVLGRRIRDELGESHLQLPLEVYDWDAPSVALLLETIAGRELYRAKFTVNSMLMADELLLMIRSLGYQSNCSQTIDASGDIIIVAVDIEVGEMINPTMIDRGLNVIWADIDCIRDEDSFSVYNVTVSEDHSYIADGKIVKNCGGTGAMISMGPDGTFYPCLRYMPSSIGDDVPGVQLGNVHNGMVGRDQGSDVLDLFDKITRRTQSNDVCYNCPIGSGCAWCSANCHQSTGTANRRTTFHCIQVIAESLANVYYWNLLNIKQPAYNLGVRKNNVPDEWALKIISQEELDFLKAIEARSAIATIDHEVKMKTLG